MDCAYIRRVAVHWYERVFEDPQISSHAAAIEKSLSSTRCIDIGTHATRTTPPPSLSFNTVHWRWRACNAHHSTFSPRPYPRASSPTIFTVHTPTTPTITHIHLALLHRPITDLGYMWAIIWGKYELWSHKSHSSPYGFGEAHRLWDNYSRTLIGAAICAMETWAMFIVEAFFFKSSVCSARNTRRQSRGRNRSKTRSMERGL